MAFEAQDSSLARRSQLWLLLLLCRSPEREKSLNHPFAGLGHLDPLTGNFCLFIIYEHDTFISP